MSNCDLLIGMNETRLDLVTAQVFASPSLRKTLFSGSQNGSYTEIPFSMTWSVNAAPTFSLRPPTADEWSGAIKSGGSPVAPQAQAFVLNLSSLSIKLTASGQTVDTTVPIKAICVVAARGAALSIEPLAVVVNTSQSSPLDRYMISNVLVPDILNLLSQTLSGIPIPSLSFGGISLTPPVVQITGSYLVVAFNLVQDGTPSLAGVQLPSDPFFVLLSPALVQSAVDYQVRTNLQGQTFNKSGNEGGGGFSAEYSTAGSIAGISVSTTPNPLALRANVSLTMSASAGINTPAGVVIDGIKKAGEAIINPDTWNPTKW